MSHLDLWGEGALVLWRRRQVLLELLSNSQSQEPVSRTFDELAQQYVVYREETIRWWMSQHRVPVLQWFTPGAASCPQQDVPEILA